ncbi:MAG: hypothetical protein LBG87_00745 [Spirochaetaceae bacterium]|jgi:hypothetical protein|nr:hypothetical protein [Spirochaetaceae bacterium]
MRLCENDSYYCVLEEDEFKIVNKETGKTMKSVKVAYNPDFAIALVAKWHYWYSGKEGEEKIGEILKKYGHIKQEQSAE